MDDYKTIRDCIEANRAEIEDSARTLSRHAMVQQCHDALAALSRLEAREANITMSVISPAMEVTGLDPDAYDRGTPIYIATVAALGKAAHAIERYAQSRIAISGIK